MHPGGKDYLQHNATAALGLVQLEFCQLHCICELNIFVEISRHLFSVGEFETCLLYFVTVLISPDVALEAGTAPRASVGFREMTQVCNIYSLHFIGESFHYFASCREIYMHQGKCSCCLLAKN